jgi:hypothetical protein
VGAVTKEDESSTGAFGMLDFTFYGPSSLGLRFHQFMNRLFI